jgi:hypothetical protein
MPKRRSILLLFILLPAAFILVLLINPWDLRERDSRRVALKDLEEVDRIVLADSYNNSELSFRNGKWYLFGTEEVNPLTVENLLFAASRLEVGSITGLEVFDEPGDPGGDVTELSYYKGERVLLTYRLKMQTGRYLLNPKDSEKAYYVSLPGYPDLDLERVFSATPDHYREHLLIDLRPSEIRYIEISLASGEAFRFTQDQEGNISCTAANEDTRIPEGEPNDLAMKLLFSYFTSIRYEQQSGISADSLLEGADSSRKMATVRLESFSGQGHSMQVFPYLEIPGAEPHLFRALVFYNDEQYAKYINYIYLDVLMRGLSHYFGEK